MTMTDESAIRARVEKAGQRHVFRFWDRLDEAGRDRLLAQLVQMDFDLLARLVRQVRGEAAAAMPADLAPIPVVGVPVTAAERAAEAEARAAGEAALAAGRVAALVVAGGQGTRLDFDGPKGLYPIGPVSGKTLFQLQTEKVLAARRRCGRPIPWLIMTSAANDRATREFFAGHDYFGLPAEDVMIFEQDTMPAVDFEGRLLLESYDRLALSPNGHGGVLAALESSGCLAALKRRGIDLISYVQVDNVLVKVIDPVFIGRHLLAGAEMSSKACRKRDADEPVGVFGLSAGRPCVVEYSDLPPQQKYAVGADGQLRFGMGSIAIHILNVEFIERMARTAALPFHLARKKVPCLDAAGRFIEPAAPNAVKFEMFVFDALREARAAVTMETAREEEFAPVKNAEGADSPATARALMTEQAARWLAAAGRTVPRDGAGRPVAPIEVSPLFALDLDEFVRRAPRCMDLSKPVYLSP
jgi:UDP-N-acetylglucosamine/UDP-N-acetylgalactosamine diphosphorylase